MASSDLFHHHIHAFNDGAGATLQAQLAANFGLSHLFMTYGDSGALTSVGRMLTADNFGRALLWRQSDLKWNHRCFFDANGKWPWNTAVDSGDTFYSAQAADIAWLKDFAFATNLSALNALSLGNWNTAPGGSATTTANWTINRAFPIWFGSQNSRSYYYNFQSKYVVSALVAQTMATMSSGQWASVTGFDSIFWDNGALEVIESDLYDGAYSACSTAVPLVSVNASAGGKGVWSDYDEGRKQYMSKVISACHATLGPHSGRSMRVFVNIWQGFGALNRSSRENAAIKRLHQWWQSGEVKCDHYYLEAGWKNAQNTPNSTVPSGYEFSGEAAFVQSGWGHLPAYYTGSSNDHLFSNSEKETFSDLMGAAIIALDNKMWLGWYGGIGADPTRTGKTAATHLLRVIPNWENMRDLPLGSRTTTGTTTSYSSPYSYASNSNLYIYAFAPAGLTGNVQENELFVVFRALTDSVTLLSGQTSIVSAETCNEVWTKSGTDVSAALNISAGVLALTNSAYLNTPIRVSLNPIVTVDPASYSVEDNFEGAASTSIQSHEPDIDSNGYGWSASTSSVVLDGFGALRALAPSISARIDISSVDQDVRLVWCSNGVDERGGIDVRCDGFSDQPNSGYRFFIAPAQNWAKIFKVNSGASSVMASTTYFFSPTNTYSLRFVVEGSNYTAYINSATALAGADTEISAGTIAGVGFGNQDPTSAGEARVYWFGAISTNSGRTISPSTGKRRGLGGVVVDSGGTGTTIVTTKASKKPSTHAIRPDVSTRPIIDYQHPLARRLMGFYLFNNTGTPINLASPAHQLENVAGFLPITLTNNGLAADAGIAANDGYWSNHNPWSLVTGGTAAYPVTIACQFRFPDSTTGNKTIFGFGSSHTFERNFVLETASTSQFRYYIFLGAGATLSIAKSGAVAGKTYTIIATSYSSSSHKVWLDGEVLGTSITDVATTGFSLVDKVVIGGDYYGSSFQNGTNAVLSWAGMWHRGFSDEEARSFNYNPSQILKRPGPSGLISSSTFYSDANESPNKGLRRNVGRLVTHSNLISNQSPSTGRRFNVTKALGENKTMYSGVRRNVGGTFIRQYKTWTDISAESASTWTTLV